MRGWMAGLMLAVASIAATPAAKDAVLEYKTAGAEARQKVQAEAAIGNAPERTIVLLADIEDAAQPAADQAFAALKDITLGATERSIIEASARRMHGERVGLRSHLRAARLMILMGDPRGYDWAVECLGDFLANNPQVALMCTGEYMGAPGDVGGLFIRNDGPQFANFVRLVTQGERPEALRLLARTLGPRDDHGYFAVQVPDPENALRNALSSIRTPLAKELSAIIFAPPPKPDPLGSLTEAERKEALAAKVTEKDFRIEVRRTPFAKEDPIALHLVKATPGLVVCKSCTSDIKTINPPKPGPAGVIGVGGRGRRFGAGGRSMPLVLARQNWTVSSERMDKFEWPEPGGSVEVTFTLVLADDTTMTVKGAFTREQLTLDPAGDVAEFMRLIGSPDPKDLEYCTRMIDNLRMESDRSRFPVKDEDRPRIAQAILKRVREAAMAGSSAPQEWWMELHVAEEGRYNGNTPWTCRQALDDLNHDNIPVEDLLPLLAAGDFGTAQWAYDAIRLKYLFGKDHVVVEPPGGWALPPTPGSPEARTLVAARDLSTAAAEGRLLELLHERILSKDANTARNAAVLLREGYFEAKHHIDWLAEAIRTTTAPDRPSEVRIAGALLAKLCRKYPDYQAPMASWIAPLVDAGDAKVAAAAMIGLAEAYSDRDRKEVLAVFEKLAAEKDPARLKAALLALDRTTHPAYVPILYRTLVAAGAKTGEHKGPLDAKAAGYLLDRLAADVKDGVALTLLLSGGYAWPLDTPVGRLQKIVRDVGETEQPLPVEGAALRLQAAGKDGAATLAADYRKHMAGGALDAAVEDLMALAALGRAGDVPAAELVAEPDLWWKDSLPAFMKAAEP